MVAVVSKTAMTADENHDAWVAVFAAVTAPPVDARRAPCPSCGHFAVGFQYIADDKTRIGFCALWCDNCAHGHVLARTRVPEGVEFLPLDAPDDELSSAIPEFSDATVTGASRSHVHDAPAVATRLAELRPQVAQYELLKALTSRSEREQDLLSPREQQVADLLREGLEVSAIARQLAVTRATVHTMIQRVYWKLGRDETLLR